MKFIESYNLNSPESTLSSAVSLKNGENIPSGVYEKGLLFVCDLENKLNFNTEHWNQPGSQVGWATLFCPPPYTK